MVRNLLCFLVRPKPCSPDELKLPARFNEVLLVKANASAKSATGRYFSIPISHAVQGADSTPPDRIANSA